MFFGWSVGPEGATSKTPLLYYLGPSPPHSPLTKVHQSGCCLCYVHVFRWTVGEGGVTLSTPLLFHVEPSLLHSPPSRREEARPFWWLRRPGPWNWTSDAILGPVLVFNYNVPPPLLFSVDLGGGSREAPGQLLVSSRPAPGWLLAGSRRAPGRVPATPGGSRWLLAGSWRAPGGLPVGSRRLPAAPGDGASQLPAGSDTPDSGF